MKDWQKIALGELVTITKGKKHVETDDVSAFRYLQIEDLNGHYTTKYTKETGTHVHEKDIVIVWDGANAGKVGCGFAGVIGSTLARLSFKEEKIETRFVKRYLDYQFEFIKSQRTGATIPHVSSDALKKLIVPLPAFSIQQKIAAILDKADELRQKDQQLLTKYDELLQSIFYQMFGDPVKNEKRWTKVKLETICDVGSSRRVFVEELVETGIPFYRGTEIGVLGLGENITPTLFITKEHYESLKKETGVPQIGDLLLPSICPDGRIYEVSDTTPFYFKDGRVLWIKVNKTKINSTFLKILLKQIFYLDYSKIASGTTFSELKIFELKKLQTPLPPFELQNKFGCIAQNLLAQKEIMRRENQASEQLFQSLLQKAFKGELVS